MSETAALRIGTRGSALALVQARHVAGELRERGVPTELVTIVTEGDRRAPDTAWGEGAFVGALESALFEDRIDVAVHSAKDVPTAEDTRLTIAAFLPREDARDVLVAPTGTAIRGLDDVPPCARVGTDSPRRGAFVRAQRPDLVIVPVHGNVDTRLRRLDAGDADVLVLAAAGLRRLGHVDRISAVLAPDVLPPAPGQGALAVQVRSDDERARSAVASLDDPSTRVAVEAERSLLRATGGGCRSPLGAFAQVDGDELAITAGYARTDGALRAVAHASGPVAERATLVDQLLRRLATSAAESAAGLPGPPRILVTRPAEDAAPTMLALVDRGLAPIAVPAVAIDRSTTPALLDAVRCRHEFSWMVVTSANGVRALDEAMRSAAGNLGDIAADGSSPRWAVVGPATAAALASLGVAAAFQPSRPTGAALAAELPFAPGGRVLLARGDLADPRVGAVLGGRGAVVEDVVAYRTVEAPASSRAPLAAALAADPVAWLATSPSSVRGMLLLADAVGSRDRIAALPVVTIGPTTSAEARRLGLHVVEAAGPEPGLLADAAASVVGRLQEIA